MYLYITWNMVPVYRQFTLAKQAANTSAVTPASFHNLYYNKDLSLTIGWVDIFYLDSLA